MTLLIKNGLVYDGQEKKPQEKDILIKRGKIVNIGKFPRSKADNVIDAGKAIVVPGFINTFTSDDHHLTIIEDPSRNELIKQGVTTVVGGSGGFSLAPFSIYSPVLLGKSKNLGGVNITWYSMREFLKVLDRIQIGVNFGTLVGFSSIKSLITTGEPRVIADKERELFTSLVAESLDGGALGVSIGADEEGFSRLPFREIDDLAKVVGEKKKILAVQVHNLKSEMSEFFEQLVSVGENYDISLQVNQLHPSEKNDFYENMTSFFRDRSSNLEMDFDCSPSGEIHLPAVYMLPPRLRDYIFAGRKDIVFASSTKEELVRYLEENFSGKEVVVDYVADQSLKFLEGKRIKDIVVNWEKSLGEALWIILKITGLKSAFKTKEIEKELLTDFIKSPFSFIASCNSRVFVEFLKISQEKKWMDLERAVAKTSSIPADKYGLKKRGVIAEGNFADLVVLRNYEVSEVILGGEVVLEKGKPTGKLNGTVLRGESRPKRRRNRE